MRKFLLLLILFIPTLKSVGLNISFTYKITKETKQDRQFENVSGDTTRVNEQLVSFEKFILYDDGFMITVDSSSHAKTIYDFGTETVTTVKDNTFDKVSLFSIIHYREAEFQNRQFLAGVLTAGGLKDTLGGLFGLESLFVIEEKPDRLKTDIKEIKNNSLLKYYYKNKKIAEIEFSQMRIDKRFKNIFTKFFLYNTNIHPLIIKSIIQYGYIPKSIEYSFSNIAISYEVRFDLIEFSNKESSLENLISIKGLVQDTSNCDTLELLLTKIYSKLSNENISLISKNECVEKNKEYISKERYFDALLTLFEYLLQSGDEPTEGIKNMMIYLNKDKDMRDFVSAISTENTKEALETAIQKLENINQDQYEKGYLLNIFLADFYTNVGFGKALTYFEKVLLKNIYITGVYKDLGEYYANEYNMEYAWKCFEIAILLNKNHPMCKEIENTKSKFRENYPDYFMATNN